MKADNIEHPDDNGQTALWQSLGARTVHGRGEPYTRFRLWFPEAATATVVGDFNNWAPDLSPMTRLDATGVWGYDHAPALAPGARYRFQVQFDDGTHLQLNDPAARAIDLSGDATSCLWRPGHAWQHSPDRASQAPHDDRDLPVTIYSLRLDAWRALPEEHRALRFDELADHLPDYVAAQGFTHVLFPLAPDRPGDAASAFAPDPDLGHPDTLMALIDRLHERGIGVLIDWDPDRVLQLLVPRWRFSRVAPPRGDAATWSAEPAHRGLLLANARFWLDTYRLDGLRLHDGGPRSPAAPASPATAVPVAPQVRATGFLQDLETLLGEFFALQVTAVDEAATGAPPAPGRRLRLDGAWLAASLDFLGRPPWERGPELMAFSERTHPPDAAPDRVLPLGRDPGAPPGPGLAARMAGEGADKLANLRLLFGYAYAQSGQTLVSMGNEFGQWHDGAHGHSLDWHLLDETEHRAMQRWTRDLNTIFRAEPALYRTDDIGVMRWHHRDDVANGVLSFTRGRPEHGPLILAVCNFGEHMLRNYRLGVPRSGHWEDRLNRDSQRYGGRTRGTFGGSEAAPVAAHGYYESLSLTLPPLSLLLFAPPDTRGTPR